jgi:hypothetical protein
MAPTITIPCGVPTTITQDIEYSVPPFSVWCQTTNALQGSLTLGGSYANFVSGIITYCFIKCVVGSAVVTLRENGVG